MERIFMITLEYKHDILGLASTSSLQQFFQCFSLSNCLTSLLMEIFAHNLIELESTVFNPADLIA